MNLAIVENVIPFSRVAKLRFLLDHSPVIEMSVLQVTFNTQEFQAGFAKCDSSRVNIEFFSTLTCVDLLDIFDGLLGGGDMRIIVVKFLSEFGFVAYDEEHKSLEILLQDKRYNGTKHRMHDMPSGTCNRRLLGHC